MKKQVMMLGLSVLLCGCGGKSVEKEGTGTYTNDSGEKTTARVKLKNDKIAEVEIDETAKGKDKTKKELGEDYGMKQASPIKKEWNEQIAFTAKYVEKHGIDKIKLNQDGKAENNDVEGCTSAWTLYKAIQDAEKKCKNSNRISGTK